MWREWRNTKLGVQYGGKTSARGADEPPVKGGGPKKGLSVADMLMRPGIMKGAVLTGNGIEDKAETGTASARDKLIEKTHLVDAEKDSERARQRGIFDGLVIYINGSTQPLISDHKLKQLLAENGARLSLHLGRRRVTHVILGRQGSVGRGAGGGLAGSKLEREIRRVGGCGIKYVSVEW